MFRLKMRAVSRPLGLSATCLHVGPQSGASTACAFERLHNNAVQTCSRTFSALSSARLLQTLASLNDDRVHQSRRTTRKLSAHHAGSRAFRTSSISLASKRDPYDVLGVNKSASKDDIKKSYYKLVKQYHPDINKDDKNAAQKFQEVQNAYEILSDDSKRAAFDNHGHAGVDAEENGQGFPGGMGGGFPGGIDPEELFAAMFGGMMGGEGPMGMGGRGPRRGQDVQTSITVNFMEAVNGTSKTITAPVLCNCGSCNGSGSADGSDPVSCKSCRGTGQQSMQQGVYTFMSTCRACGGQGTMIKNPCKKCGGMGVQRKPKSITVNIPPGVDSGINLRMAGEGDTGLRGAPAGHLFVRINVEPDPFFQREGADIHVKVPLSITQAALGASITVPTVKGEEKVSVPAGTQPGDVVTLRGKGVRRLGSSSSGNQVVHLELQVPKTLTPKMKQLLQDLESEMKGGSSSGSSSSSSSGSGAYGTGTESSAYTKLFQDTLGRIKKAMNAK